MRRATLSIPDPVFKEAEALARRRGVSRSELYAAALKWYLERESLRSDSSLTVAAAATPKQEK